MASCKNDYLCTLNALVCFCFEIVLVWVGRSDRSTLLPGGFRYQMVAPSPVESLKAIHHFRIDHNAPCLSPKSLHNHCFQLLLSITVVPWEIEDNEFHCRKWWIVRNSCELRLSVTLSPVFFSLSFKASILASCSLTVYCSWPSRSRSSPTCLSSSCTVWCWIPLRTTARIKQLREFN